jgi:hypothetical protein
MKWSACIVAMISAGMCWNSVVAEWTVEKDDEGVVVKRDGKLVTHYLVKSGNKPILWPIVGPTGKEMTRAYPMRKEAGIAEGKYPYDHVHQRSCWFTHGSVNGVSFWEEVNPKHRPGEQAHKAFKEMSGGEQAKIVSQTEWKNVDENRTELEDERTIVFHDEGDARVMDFTVVLKATQGDVQFGETKEGSFGLRVPTSMDVDMKQGGQIVNSQGETDANAWGKASPWVDYHGPVDGEKLGIAVLNHPSSFRYPTRWHVRTYGLYAANPWGTKDFTGGKESGGEYKLPKGESLTLRYRVIFHKGDEKEAKIAARFEQFAAER